MSRSWLIKVQHLNHVVICTHITYYQVLLITKCENKNVCLCQWWKKYFLSQPLSWLPSHFLLVIKGYPKKSVQKETFPRSQLQITLYIIQKGIEYVFRPQEDTNIIEGTKTETLFFKRRRKETSMLRCGTRAKTQL